MPRHPALQSQTILDRAYVAWHPKHRRLDVIATVGDALQYLIHLPAKYDDLTWALASSGLCWAHQDPDGVDHATRAFENAIITDNFYVKAVPAT
jgi:hypothetical protein